MAKRFFPIVICTRSSAAVVRYILDLEGVDVKKIRVVKRTSDLLASFSKDEVQLAFIQLSSGSVKRFVDDGKKIQIFSHEDTVVLRYKCCEDIVGEVPRMCAFLAPTVSLAA
jgi:hypothetical protein